MASRSIGFTIRENLDNGKITIEPSGIDSFFNIKGNIEVDKFVLAVDLFMQQYLEEVGATIKEK